MKKVASLVLTMIIVMAVASVAFASGNIPGTGWWSGEQIQNVGTGTGTVTITAYDAESPATYDASKDIAAGASATFIPSDFVGMPAGFQGSAVVSSNQDIRAIVNVTNRQVGDFGVAGGLAAAQYQGMNQGDTTINFPLAKNDYFNKTTTFYIQNAGTEAATADATFFFGGTAYNYTTPAIGPGQMVIVTPADATGAPSGDTDGVGSLTVVSTQPLAGSVLEHSDDDATAKLLQATRGFVTTDGDTTLYAPIIKSVWFNRFTGLQVQNSSGSPVDIQVEYTGSGGACAGTTYNDSATGVGPGESHTFVHLPAQSPLPENCLASATVTADGEITAIVNESYTGAFVAAGNEQESTTYSAVPANAETMIVSAPLFKENSYNKGTGLQVQNVGGSNASVTLTFTGATGTYVSTAQSIAPGASMTFVDVRLKPASFWDGTAMTEAALGCAPGCGSNGVFSVIVESNQPVVAIANESTYPFTAPAIAQDKNNYEGFNLTALPGQ